MRRDLVGFVSGRLTVIEMTDRKNTWNKIYWKCICECGNTVEVLGDSIFRGETKSCGCYRKEISGNLMRVLSRDYTSNFIIDLTNKKFGSLRVISIVESDGRKRRRWLCECDCGNFHITNTDSLNSGQCKSCGCLSESWIASELKKYFIENYNAIAEYKILKNLKSKHYLPYDIYIPSHSIFVEIHGAQHYDFVEYWHKDSEGFEYSKQKDDMKKTFAKKNGIYVEIDLRKIKTLEKAIKKIEGKFL